MEKSLLAQSLQAQFPDSAEQEIVSSTLGDWIPEEHHASITAYAAAKLQDLHEMIEAVGETEDEQELYNTLAMYWLELKTEWFRYNHVMNYLIIRTGSADPALVARGTICSGFLARFESLLSPADLAALTDIAAQPLEIGRPSVEQLTRFLDRFAKTKTVINKAVERAEQAGGATDDLKDEARGITKIELREIWPAIAEQVMAKTATPQPYTVRGLWSGSETVEADWIQPIVNAVATFIDDAFGSHIKTTPEQRIEAGQSASVAFAVHFETTDGNQTITIEWPDSGKAFPVDVAGPVGA